MTLTRKMLDTRYAWWFHGKRNTEQAKKEILRIFSQEPDDGHKWTEQDIVRVGRKTPHTGRREMTNLVKEKSPTARLVNS